MIATEDHDEAFEVLHTTGTSQAAMMTLDPGEASSGRVGNEHAWAEQWVYVISGQGEALCKKRRLKLRAGSLLLVERGEQHQIRNTGKTPLVTLDVYVPPAYDDDGEPLY
ncbi:MAG: cupin domain-containing protein [Acidobacteriota bacterium]